MNTAALKKMAEFGLTIDQAIEVLEAMNVSDRSSAAERQARYRQRKKEAGNVTSDVTCDVTPPPFPDKEISPTPPKETNPTPLISPQTGASAKFDQFWSEYPHKVGKADARRKFDVALKRTNFPSLMAGLRRYCDKTDDRPWCNPATWLHQERWDDAPAVVAEQRNRGSPPRGTGNGPVDFIEQLFKQAESQNAAFSGNFEADSAPVIELSARRR